MSVSVTNSGGTLCINDGNSIRYPDKNKVDITSQGTNVTIRWDEVHYVTFPASDFSAPTGTADAIAATIAGYLDSGAEVTGSGTSGYIPKWNTSTSLTDSLLYSGASAIGLGTTSPNATSLFEMVSTTKGLLIPRMTTAQKNAITTPATSLLVFDTDLADFYYYNGSAWASVGGSSALSALTAATATNSINSGNFAQTWAWNTLAGTTAMTLSSSSTAAAGNAQILMLLALSGANASSTQTTTTARFTNQHTGTSSTNIALHLVASGGTNNYGLIVEAGDSGFGITAPTARVHIQGAGATSATYGLQVHNSTGTNNALIVRDDGNVGIGTASPETKLHISSSTNNAIQFQTAGGLSDRAKIFLGQGSGGYNAQELYIEMVNSSLRFRGHSGANAEYFSISGGSPGPGAGRISACYSGTSAANFNSSHFSIQTSSAVDTYAADILNDVTGSTTQYGVRSQSTGTNTTNIGGYFAATGATNNYAIIVPSNGGLVGVGTVSPSASLHIVGSGATSATYALKVDNSASTSLFYVRNDGYIDAGTSVGNLTIGRGSGFNNTLNYNTFIGVNAGASVTTGGEYNTAIGGQSMYSLTNGTLNTAIGNASMYSILGGQRNVAIGQRAMFSSTSASDNVAIGRQALEDNVSGARNVAIGYLALQKNLEYDNTAIGAGALGVNTSGNNNTAIGAAAMSTNTTGDYTTALGYQAGFSMTTNGGGVFLGANAGYYETAANKLFIDNSTRANESDGRVKALVYGEFNATYTNQLITFNARTIVNGRLLQTQGADVASAGDLTLGSDGNVFEITGTTTINAITTATWQNGTPVTLLFTSTPTVKHNTAGGAGTAVILLAGAADFSATAGDTLTLVLSEIGGTQAWREVARAVI